MGTTWDDTPVYPRATVTAARLQAARMKHDELVDRIGELALRVGRRYAGPVPGAEPASPLRIHYNPDSRRIRRKEPFARGFPDLVVAGPGGVLFAELKCADDTISPDQRAWGARLTGAGQCWVIWEPLDVLSGRIETELASLCLMASTKLGIRPAPS